MTHDELETLKREYNTRINKARPMWEELAAIAMRLHNIQEVMREHDADALIHCIFAGEFELCNEATTDTGA